MSTTQQNDLSSSTQHYRLLYFNFRWIAEPIRYLLSYQGKEFEDVRLDWDEWEKGNIDKEVYRYAKLPILEEMEPNSSSPILSLGQSFTILRYLGKKYGLAGRSLSEEAKCEEISDCLNDILHELEDLEELLIDDEMKKEKLITKILTLTIPRYFDVFEKDLKDKKAGRDASDKKMPLVGDNLTWVDFQFAHFSELFEEFLHKRKRPKHEALLENLFAGYPMIKEHQKWIFGLEAVLEWRMKRPITEY